LRGKCMLTRCTQNCKFCFVLYPYLESHISIIVVSKTTITITITTTSSSKLPFCHASFTSYLFLPTSNRQLPVALGFTRNIFGSPFGTSSSISGFRNISKSKLHDNVASVQLSSFNYKIGFTLTTHHYAIVLLIIGARSDELLCRE
jgi:hypothetical protein